LRRTGVVLLEVLSTYGFIMMTSEEELTLSSSIFYFRFIFMFVGVVIGELFVTYFMMKERRELMI